MSSASLQLHCNLRDTQRRKLVYGTPMKTTTLMALLFALVLTGCDAGAAGDHATEPKLTKTEQQRLDKEVECATKHGEERRICFNGEEPE
jgi:hypothetical protein